MIIDSGKTFNEQKVGYSIEDDGYSIYLNEKIWITQPEPYAKLYIADGSYEDNVKAQIEEITTPHDPVPTTEEQIAELKTQNEELSATLDSMLTDVIPAMLASN